MKYLILIAATLIAMNILYGSDVKQVAITIDDLPTLSHGILDSTEQKAYFNRILDVLDDNEIQSVGFMTGHLIQNYSEHLIDSFIARGHELGDHTYSHYDLNSTDCAKYIEDIEYNSQIISHYQSNCRYFRYPMLHRGNVASKRDSIFDYLEKKSYTIAPVTIDTYEADYNIRFVRAFFSGENHELIGQDYLEHMINQTEYYDSLAVETSGRNVNHILLLHMNFINSYYLADLLNWYKSNGWEFITLEEALEDPIYQIPDKSLSKRGISWLERISCNK